MINDDSLQTIMTMMLYLTLYFYVILIIIFNFVVMFFMACLFILCICHSAFLMNEGYHHVYIYLPGRTKNENLAAAYKKFLRSRSPSCHYARRRTVRKHRNELCFVPDWLNCLSIENSDLSPTTKSATDIISILRTLSNWDRGPSEASPIRLTAQA